MNIGELRSRAQAFSAELQRVKDTHPPDGFSWYGHDILANLVHFDHLLTGEIRDLFEALGDAPIADVGAADGDLSYFLESVGLTSDIIDYGRTNWNGLRGARQLKGALGSSVAIHEVDLDAYFEMPRSRYGLILMLGILYHLKNPFYVLERFARHSELLILSTRIARFAPDGSPLRELPLAYLLAPDECGNDATNFWIFSEAGLRRILERAGWEIVDFHTAGDLERSNPADPDHDERAFVLARRMGG